MPTSFSITERLSPLTDGFPFRQPSRIAAVGDSRSVLAGERGSHTRVVDLSGLTVLPGLIDSHVHPLAAGLSEFRSALPVFDSYANPYNPFLGMWTEVTRLKRDGKALHPEQKISREEALRSYAVASNGRGAALVSARP